ncbi:MAG: hypothetical protein ABR600_13730 [Actinomycetota bacterium]
MKRSFLAVAVAASLALLGALVTVRPALSVAPVGAFLNPSGDATHGGPGTLLSAKDDGTDSTFHFSVRATPATAGATIVRVGIQYRQPSAVSFATIADATSVGPDTWEWNWDVLHSGVAEGKTGAVRAVVEDSNGELAFVPGTDGLSVVFDDSLPTVEMTKPPNGGDLGFNGQNATISGTSSGDADEIDAYYSTTGPGPDPVWTSCGSATVLPTGSPSQWSLTCKLAATDKAEAVQAVAVVPVSHLPSPLGTMGSGDAHRVTGFSQSPNSVTINPPSITETVGHCHYFTMQVLDATGASVGGRQVSVHITGPGANVRFGNGGPVSSFTSPSNATAHDAFETADTCDKYNVGSGGGQTPAAPGQSGQEGIHASSNAKHIVGTTTADGFTFAVVGHNAGSTAIEAWYDVNGNDENDNASPACPESGPVGAEQCATASINWEAPRAASVTLSPTEGQADPGGSHDITGQAVDQAGNVLAGQAIAFAVTSGLNAAKDLDGSSGTPAGYFGSCFTGQDGTCQRAYTDLAAQDNDDTITGFIDSDGNLKPGTATSEPQANARQRWGNGTPASPMPTETVTPTAAATELTIAPAATKTIHRGQRVVIHGRLGSSTETCPADQTIELLRAGKVVSRTRTSANASQRSNGTWAAAYSFSKRPKTTQRYHVEFDGTSGCGSSRAPRSGDVVIRVRPR